MWSTIAEELTSSYIVSYHYSAKKQHTHNEISYWSILFKKLKEFMNEHGSVGLS